MTLICQRWQIHGPSPRWQTLTFGESASPFEYQRSLWTVPLYKKIFQSNQCKEEINGGVSLKRNRSFKWRDKNWLSKHVELQVSAICTPKSCLLFCGFFLQTKSWLLVFGDVRKDYSSHFFKEFFYHLSGR